MSRLGRALFAAPVASVLLILAACTGPPRTAVTATAAPRTAAPVAVATTAPASAPAPTEPSPPRTPTPPDTAIDRRLAGQTRYIANTDGIGVKARTTCDDRPARRDGRRGRR